MNYVLADIEFAPLPTHLESVEITSSLDCYYHCPRVCNVTGVCNTRFPPLLNKLVSSNFAQSIIKPIET
jgi:hypothetical protein